jgi:Fusaric acid resistance protein-like
LIVAAVLMGATGVMLVATGVWALTFRGVMSRELRAALNGHTLTSTGVLSSGHLFILIRAIAVSGAVAIAFGLQLTNADWMPLATLIAMKPTLQQSTLRGTQRLVGTALGAAIAAVFLVTVPSIRALEEIIIVLMGVGPSVYAVNYALYTKGRRCLNPPDRSSAAAAPADRQRAVGPKSDTVTHDAGGMWSRERQWPGSFAQIW